MAKISLIACVSKDRGLGKDGALLWKIPQDMEFFKKMTTGHPIIMGKKTYASIGQPLPGRINVVLAHEPVAGEVKWVKSVEELNDYLAGTDEEVFIIGGASLYEMFLPKAETVYLTEVDAKKPADTFFPEFHAQDYDCQVLQSGAIEDHYFDIVKYQKKA